MRKSEDPMELVEGTQVPILHATAKVDTTGEWGTVLAKLKERLAVNQPAGKRHIGLFVALLGGSGPGKTQMGVELIRETREMGWGGKYARMNWFFLDLKATYVKDSETSERDVLIQYAKPTMLVLDEVGKRKGTDWEDSLLYELIDKRYGSCKDTMLISNESEEQFAKSMGASIMNRLGECGGIILANWANRRAA